MIHTIKHVTARTGDDFIEKLNDAVHRHQRDGYDVEIQYSSAADGFLWYSAILILRPARASEASDVALVEEAPSFWDQPTQPYDVVELAA